MPDPVTKPAPAPQPAAASTENHATHEEIATLAYSLWQARGYPEGTPDEDWLNAEKALKAKAEA